MDAVNPSKRRMSQIPLKDIKDGDAIVPMHAKLFQYFSPRSRIIQVVSFGVDSLGLEVNISEQTGCVVNMYDQRQHSHTKITKALEV